MRQDFPLEKPCWLPSPHSLMRSQHPIRPGRLHTPPSRPSVCPPCLAPDPSAHPDFNTSSRTPAAPHALKSQPQTPQTATAHAQPQPPGPTGLPHTAPQASSRPRCRPGRAHLRAPTAPSPPLPARRSARARGCCRKYHGPRWPRPHRSDWPPPAALVATRQRAPPLAQRGGAVPARPRHVTGARGRTCQCFGRRGRGVWRAGGGV